MQTMHLDALSNTINETLMPPPVRGDLRTLRGGIYYAQPADWSDVCFVQILASFVDILSRVKYIC
jgi:hypothetical protein